MDPNATLNGRIEQEFKDLDRGSAAAYLQARKPVEANPPSPSTVSSRALSPSGIVGLEWWEDSEDLKS